MSPSAFDNKTELIVKRQKEFFGTGGTLPVETRLSYLKELKSAITKHERDICEALQTDLGKSAAESYMCEIGLVQSEIGFMLKNMRKLMKKKRARTPMAQYVSKSYVVPEPLGTVLIMSPWNYPFLLTVEPLVDAVAAGNTAVVKPSAYSEKTSAVIKTIIEEVFPPEYVSVITGGREENAQLLSQKYDLIFFTGSQSVGRVVMEHAAKNLTPVVLELGGKSPCVVDESAKLPLAAKRIVWGKYLNCGQTCVAPDYVLCHVSVKDQLIKEIIKQIKLQFTEAPLGNPDYGKIINKKHFDRIRALIDRGKTVYGGDGDENTCMIEPTVMDNVTWDDAVMKQEIFGPVLPVMTYETTDEIINTLSEKQKPLAMYVFSENRDTQKKLLERCRFGGGCVNDTVIHLATSRMPFGGVGESGMGSYHGKDGFKAFSHYKSIVDKKTWMDLPMRYQPFTALHDRLIRMFIH